MAQKQSAGGGANGSSASSTSKKRATKSEAPAAKKASGVSGGKAQAAARSEVESAAARPSIPPASDGMRTLTSAPSHEDIAQRAFFLYQARGGNGGDPLQDWLAAERELSR